LTLSLPGRRGIAVLLLLVALTIRGWDFGNPVIDADEQYYLLVGDHMLHGAVPYIDLWDRKPIGLFALFAAIRLLPGDGILAYQLLATAVAWATALVVAVAAGTLGANRRGALAAGMVYLASISLLSGGGGQAPVFYNLPMAFAALLTLRLPARAAREQVGAIVVSGTIACLLAGIAIQMKYTPMFEGAFFGMAHLWFLHRAGARLGTIVGPALLWIVMGLAPTLGAIGWYLAKGSVAFDAFWFANVTSIALRPGYPAGRLAIRLLSIFAQLLPLLAAAAITWRRRARSGLAAETMTIAFAWTAAAMVGFLVIGTFFDHYGLPLVAPLAILAAPTLGRSRRMLGIALTVSVAILIADRVIDPDERASARAVAAVIEANSGSECPYVFVGPSILYHLAHACVPTPYAFPNLLAYATEQGAIGIDQPTEVRRIMANRPPVVVTSDRRTAIYNPDTLRVMAAALAHDYRAVFSVPGGKGRVVVYLRRDRRYFSS
jgi:4-amino-4-deoxy-L-arabinose transferase-like glycosyltransferase